MTGKIPQHPEFWTAKGATSIPQPPPRRPDMVDAYLRGRHPSPSIHLDAAGFIASLRQTSAPPPAAPAPFAHVIPAEDERRLRDGYDASRDLTGVEAREGRPDEPYRLRVDLDNLRPDAADGHLDVYWLVGTGPAGGATALPDQIQGSTTHPWNLAVAAYDPQHSAATDASGHAIPGAVTATTFDAARRTVEVALDKAALRQAGWRDGQPLTLQAFTTRDFGGQVTDSLDAAPDKPWQNGGVLRAAVSTADPPAPLPARSADWAGENVYFAFTDRFNDGDPNNDFGVDKGDLRHYHGGDLRGVIDKLDYIKGLGMTAIWISPPMANQTREGNYDGFHGYWPVDFYQVDRREGDMATMQELVRKAHAKGLKVLMDLPLNQTAWDHPWTHDPSKYGWYHHNGSITNWNDPVQLETYDVMGLPDLAQENPAVEKELINVAKFWIDQTGIDGFRLDAVKHVGHPFWEHFEKAIREHAGPDFLLLGEDLDGDPDHVGQYQREGMDSLFDYPLYFTILDTLARGGPMSELADRLAQEDGQYDNARMMSVFLDNHDVSRFMTEAGPDARRKLELALAFAFTIDRIPTVYQGTEVGMEGAQEMESPDHMPHNRADMEFGKDPELQAYFTKLATLRRDTPALRGGGYREMWRDNDVFAYERIGKNTSAVVALNSSGGEQTRDLPAPDLPEGLALRDALSGREVVVRDGRLHVTMPPRTPAIFLPA